MNEEIEPLNIFCKDTALIDRTIKYFNLFLALYFDDEKTIETLNSNEVTIDLMLRFGTFISNFENNKNATFKQSSIFKLISCLVSTCLKTRFPSSEIYSDTNPYPDWYTKLRRELGKKAANNSITRGEAIVSKSIPVGEEMLKKIFVFLYQEGFQSS